MYEGFSLICMKCFHKKKKPALSEKMVHRLQKVKYIVLALILLSCLTGVYGKLTGTSPWDVFSMLTARRLPDSTYLYSDLHIPNQNHPDTILFFLPVILLQNDKVLHYILLPPSL